ncbi:MAG: hypothetical protein WCR49_06795 [Opitutae bacterium]
MRVLRILVAGLIAVAAVIGVLFAAALVFFTGLVAYVVQLLRRPAGPGPVGPPPHRATRMQMDDAIDVVSTNVPVDPPGR